MIKRVIAEMGGKNAIIVDETADLDEAIRLDPEYVNEVIRMRKLNSVL